MKRLVCVLLTISYPVGSAWADSYLFDMDNLPSLDGAAFVVSPTDFPNESAVAEIVNGQLLIDTIGQSVDLAARYAVDDPWDPSVDAKLTWRARVEAFSVPNPTTAQVVLTASSGLQVNIIMREDRVVYNDGNVFANFSPPVLVDTSVFHTYRVAIPANSNHFDLFIDGQWAAAATAPITTGSTPRLLFGDGSASGGNVRMRIKQVKLDNCGYVNK